MAAKLNHFLQSFGSFLKQLLGRYGVVLLMLLVGVILPFHVFGELAEEVWENEGGFPWDEPILLALHQTANPQADWFASTLTRFGVFWGVFPVAGAIALYCLWRRRWRWLIYLTTTLLGSIVINRSAKLLLHRVRPNLWESAAPEFDYGFPSGHAMSSMSLVALLAILTWHWRWRWLVWVGGGIFVLLIGWTRLYLGVHYPSDILAGWAVSVGWAVGVSLILKPHAARQLQPDELPETRE